MSNKVKLSTNESIEKLKVLVEDIKICMFCTNLKFDDGSSCRPMLVQKVCDQGNIWFFSDFNSIKNIEIQQGKHVKLFFAHPGIGSYLVVTGEAEIILDNNKIAELWTPMAQKWFKKGKDDKHISIIKVKPGSVYYWDTAGNRMINFFKMVASIATGSNLISGEKVKLKV